MNIIHSIDQFKDELLKIERPLGLVPTMGAIHSGHMALIQRARLENAMHDKIKVFSVQIKVNLIERLMGFDRSVFLY